MKTMKTNSKMARALLANVIPRIAAKDWTETVKSKQVGHTLCVFFFFEK